MPDNALHLDRVCMQNARAGTPTGYKLANGVVVVWGSPNGQNNFATEEKARAAFPTLHILCPTCQK